MAYKTEDLFNKAKEAIEKHKLFFIEDIVAFMPCDKTTFYRHFPVDCNEYNDLKEMLEKNRTEIKTSMRSKWYKSNAPTLQMALYKLIATPDEHKALQMNYTDVTSQGKRILPKIEWEDGDSDEL
jgi:thiamine pyrophosphate-dependent acetolactate synthase large subunit-like protein